MNHTDNFAKLMNEYAPLIARVASTYEANSSIREDLIQEISLAVWRALETFRGDASVKTFIARIAHNRAVDHVLKETRRQDRQQTDDSLLNIAAKTDSQSHEQQLDLITALRKLAVGYRQVIALQLEGFSQAQIGEILGLSESNVAQRASRAKKQLEQILNRSPA